MSADDDIRDKHGLAPRPVPDEPETHSVTGQPLIPDNARYALRNEALSLMGEIISKYRDNKNVTSRDLAKMALNYIDMDELAALLGFTVTTEWRVVDAKGRDNTRDTDEASAREWAAHCNGAGHTDRDENTYQINERPFHVESRTIFTGPWATPQPLTEWNRVDSLSGSYIDQGRLLANAEAVDDIYPGYRAALPNTLAVLKRRGPVCDTCLTPAIWSGAGLGWCHLVDGRNVLPHQDTSGHRPDMTTWNAL